VKRGITGNPLQGRVFLREACYGLVYLELAGCRLRSLPGDLGGLVPNLRVLNLNYNFLEELEALGGLTRLKKLTVIGSRVKSTKAVIRLVERLPEMEMLDCR